MVEHLRVATSCVYLWILRSFSEYLFYRAPLRNCLFHVQVADFQAADTEKNYFTGAFQIFYTRTRNKHSKAFIYLKCLKIICEEVNPWWSCEMPTCNFTKKKPLSHIVRYMFCFHFPRTHQKGFGCVRANFLSGKISKYWSYLWCNCSVTIHRTIFVK